MLAKQWRKESIEEMEHADKLVERIIFLDGLPNMQVLDPLHIGQNVKEVLDCDLAAEMSARALYEEAATHCHSVRDYVTRDMFEKLMHDEEEHIDFLETQLDLVAKLGLELYAQHHIGLTRMAIDRRRRRDRCHNRLQILSAGFGQSSAGRATDVADHFPASALVKIHG